jgi:hypothetical protein
MTSHGIIITSLLLFDSDLGSMAFGRLWLQIGMSGWLTGDYSLRCQPVDYSDRPQVLRVGLPSALLTNISHLCTTFCYLQLLPATYCVTACVCNWDMCRVTRWTREWCRERESEKEFLCACVRARVWERAMWRRRYRNVWQYSVATCIRIKQWIRQALHSIDFYFPLTLNLSIA